MRFFTSVVTAIVSFAFLEAVVSAHNVDASVRKRHSGRAPSAPPLGRNVSSAHGGESTLVKRFDNTRFSYYKAGLGACGKTNSGNDFIVAMNQIQFDSEDFCFKTITVNYKGKSAQAQIVDRCVECPYGALDFSQGLFEYMSNNNLDLGYLYGSWNFGSGEPKPTPKPEPTTTKEKPTSSSTPTPTPKPTTTPEKTSTKESSTTTSHSTTTSSSSTSVIESKTSTSSAAPSETTIAFPTDGISQLNLVLLNLANVVVGGASIGTGGQ
ncbi:hypothetical protein D9615_001858 [Tricholomella constricta]|uniref:Uncharacterized protein n=1 Tax=Tricholomella constricta TaxID=117010 RepID=A0A8H5HP02_9AGAR|nr:hypothetical protein D9615_001858 [Tricholomella constricta]